VSITNSEKIVAYGGEIIKRGSSGIIKAAAGSVAARQNSVSMKQYHGAPSAALAWRHGIINNGSISNGMAINKHGMAMA